MPSVSKTNSMTKKKSLKQFIEECREIDGGKYDYSITKYTNWESKIEYICPIHGVQSQPAQHHRRGRGCKKCGREKTRIAFAYKHVEFLERANRAHNNRYRYTNAVYTGYKGKVRIECEIHGEFVQAAGSHIAGRGCPKCGLYNKSPGPLIKPVSGEEFVKLSIEVHGNQYDYSQVEYKKYHSSVMIVCSTHGPFKCVPTSHLKGLGCATCQSLMLLFRKQGLFMVTSLSMTNRPT